MPLPEIRPTALEPQSSVGQRFWARQTDVLDLSDAGFLRDPTEHMLRTPAPLTLADMEDRPALALLGEPGIGKSTALSAEAARIGSRAGELGRSCVRVDLRSFGTDAMLYRRLFEAPDILDWRDGTSHLFLHLDSLDEALLRIDTVANLLASELPGLPTGRLSLRVACRTAVWPAETLGRALVGIWGEEGVEVRELAPLRRSDVLAAAEAVGIAPAGFLGAVFAAGAMPFAIKPLTLRLLLKIYAANGELPSSTADLFREGCLALCEEQNASRRESGRRGSAGAAERLRVAGRIAAAMLFANKYAVWTGVEAERPVEDVAVSALSGARETGPFGSFVTTRDDVRETLDTGLFSSRGEARLGWAHHGYAEFLAAAYLFDRGIPAGTALRLLRHPAGGLVPQLSTVAAWAASISSEVRAALMAEEPVALMRGDLSNWGAEDLSTLAGSLLRFLDGQRLHGEHFGLVQTYGKLMHPGLAAQLRMWIEDGTRGLSSRRAAVSIAERCGLAELQPELLSAALDAGEDASVRSLAVSALKRCSDASVPARILPLARGEVGPDPHQDIRGKALDLLWPTGISATDLFALLVPSLDNYFGSYAYFLSTLPDALADGDLRPGLHWATALLVRVGHDGAYREKTLADAIMVRSWAAFERPELIEPFIDHIGVRLRDHGEIWRGTDYKARDAFLEALARDGHRRRRFMSAVLRYPMDRLRASDFGRTGFLVAGDLEWLIAISPAGAEPLDGVDPDSILNSIVMMCDLKDERQFEAVYVAAQRWPALSIAYAAVFEGISLDSPEVAQQRAWFARKREMERQAPPPLCPDPARKVAESLDGVDAGQSGAWSDVNAYLGLKPDSRGWSIGLEYSITTLPGWAEADEATRRRIARAAELFLVGGEPTTGTWLGKEPMPVVWNDVCGFRAFVLLAGEYPDKYARIGNATWRKWTPVIVGLPRRAVAEGSPNLDQLVQHALGKAHDEFVGTVIRLIHAEKQRIRARSELAGDGSPAHFHILHDLPGCWGDEVLKRAVHVEAIDDGNGVGETAALLEPLLRIQYEPAFHHAVALAVDGSKPGALREAAAGLLLDLMPLQAWPTLKATIHGDEALARGTFARVASHLRLETPFYVGLAEEEVAEIYRALSRLFPRPPDPDLDEGLVSTFDSIGHLRDGIPRYLAHRGTVPATLALRRLVADLGDQPWLAYELGVAEQAMRVTTWSPLSVREILALTDKPGMTMVTSAADLRDVLLAALARWQAELHGAQNPVRALWDRQKDGSFRPIDEDGLSDNVNLFLQRELLPRGIFANREVEVARVPGAPIGTRTDILINAVRRGADGTAFDALTAVIETKGCWNPGLLTSLEAQLFKDYMARLGAPVGIYLVGWFDATKWDGSDGRKRKVPSMTLEEARGVFAAQALRIPSDFLIEPVVLDCHAP